MAAVTTSKSTGQLQSILPEKTDRPPGGWFYFWTDRLLGLQTRVFPRMVVPQNGWFIMENLIKMDDFGVPLLSETSTCLWIMLILFLLVIDHLVVAWFCFYHLYTNMVSLLKYCWWFRNPANQLKWYVVYPITYSFLYIPSGCLGFLLINSMIMNWLTPLMVS